MTRKAILFATAATLVLALAPSVGRAVVPGQISYQGLLLDSVGDPVTGNQDFAFALYDAPSGGSLLWSESHDDVPVLDGVYDVVLGSTTPITPALVSGGALHLEITVGGETLAPRQQLLAVPYALSAESAESASSVDGLSSVFVTQAFEHFAFDGQDPPNQDASEGVADVDGDGVANFIDPDNDDDGIEDADELARGSDINLVTPTIAGFSPPAAAASETTGVTISGQGFEPGLSVSFGAETPTPTNVTSTSFDVAVGPQAAGTKSVVATNPNAESDGASFDFADPILTDVNPDVVDSDSTTPVTATGTGFLPGLQVTVGTQNLTPQNLSFTSFHVDVGPQPASVTTFDVFYPSGPVSSLPFEIQDLGDKTAFVTTFGSDGDLGGIAGADAFCAARAAAGSFSGTFLAWLGDATTNPAARFSGNGPYRTSTGKLIANDFSDLADGVIDNPIREDELRNTVPLNAPVWTNVATDGTTAGADDCSGWTSTSGNGLSGNSSATGSTWTDSTTSACSQVQRLYCFEQ